MKAASWVVCLAASVSLASGRQSNLDRTYDLLHQVAYLDFDPVKRVATGSVQNTFTMLRDGIVSVHFDHSADRLWDVRIDGKPAEWTNAGDHIDVKLQGGRYGTRHTLSVQLETSKFVWYTPDKSNPNRVGLSTEGLTALPVGWNQPNDFATSEVHLTVPKEWSAISNGSLISDRPVGAGKHTVVWKMDQPHAGYLNSLAIGPYDTFTDSWRGKPLIMTCPKGYGGDLKYTFARTKDILDYFSQRLGVEYPWTKYAQSVVYGHQYGEENVSATIYGIVWSNGHPESILTNERVGPHTMDWLFAHETAHQWFGDLVTCKDWTHVWLNEAFATFMEMMYILHSRGDFESLREKESYSQRYFNESRSVLHAIQPKPADLGMTWTIYHKGAMTLMTLRSMLGDDAFFRGLSQYVRSHKFGNAETNDFCEAMTDASGIDLHPWFDQWIYKPGHPVIDWSWSYDAAKRSAVVRVRQTQDTSKGVPIYRVPTHVGIVTASGLQRVPVTLTTADDTFSIPASDAPLAVVFDPDHDFLREIPKSPWASGELLPVFLSAPNPVDREYALARLCERGPTEAELSAVARSLRQDVGLFPSVVDTSRLAALKAPGLRGFWMSELTHPNASRRANAVTGFANLAVSAEDRARLRDFTKDDQPYAVVAAAVRGLAHADPSAAQPIALRLAKGSDSADVRVAALETLANARTPGWIEAILDTAAEESPYMIRRAGIDCLRLVPRDDPRLASALRSALHSGEEIVAYGAIRAAGAVRLKALLPDLRELKGHSSFDGDIDRAIRATESEPSNG